VRLLPATAVILALLCSCSDNGVVTSYDIEEIKNVTWQLTAFETQEGVESVHPADTILILFENEPLVRGSSAGQCGNRFQARYILKHPNAIQVDSLISTEMACPASKYWQCVSALGRVNSARRDRDWLYLYHDNPSSRLIFARVPCRP
jgi:heat shock protein HslJ